MEMRRIERAGREGDHRPQNAHLQHGDGDGRRHAFEAAPPGAQDGAPEQQRRSEGAQVHQPVDRRALEGRHIGAGRMPDPQRRGEGAGGQDRGPARRRGRGLPGRPAQGRQRRGHANQEHVLADPGREQRHRQRTDRGDQGKAGQPPACREQRLPPPRQPVPPGEEQIAYPDRRQRRDEHGVEIPTAPEVERRRRRAAIGLIGKCADRRRHPMVEPLLRQLMEPRRGDGGSRLQEPISGP